MQIVMILLQDGSKLQYGVSCYTSRLIGYCHLASLLLLTSRNKHTDTRVDRISDKSLGNLIEDAFWNVNCTEGCAEGCAERQSGGKRRESA